MEIRFQHSSKETAGMNTSALRDHFMLQQLLMDDQIRLVYTHYDRVIIGVARPVNNKITLPNYPELKAAYFLERREMGIINVGGNGIIQADGTSYALGKMDCLYLGRGVKQVEFVSDADTNPALFYILSAPAHKEMESVVLRKEAVVPVALGDASTANKRTIYKYIHAAGIQSCQLVMGLTVLAEGSVWNTMPAHTHTRRMEVYFYFDIPDNQFVLHLMGEPSETRHIVMNNYTAVISPPWSIHAGCGSAAYSFIWGMAGENSDYTDMDPVPTFY